MISVGIVGGAGYTAGELIRILLYHPKATIHFVQSNSQAGKAISEIHTDLIGELDMDFIPKAIFSVDIIFLCMGHGKSKSFFDNNDIPKTCKIIDLSHDFRIKKEGNVFVYGLPELNKPKIKQADYIANCGCFATAIQLALLPLAKNQLLQHDIHVHAITGATGAGQLPRATTHFSWRNNNLSVYKAFQHQHLQEIKQSLVQLQNDFDAEINFIPVRGDFPRGIFASVYTKFDGSLEEAANLYQRFYQDDPFTIISLQNPNLKQVVNTNKCILHLEKHGNKLLIISEIDNLIKGASGQAVQNMNLMFGFEETMGLLLKAVVF
ncbi:MAG TPA: N-acetyl-gamma-glutamyl-phosphate reductase [Saprospiraceae bacterium]|nr:N-acetyl-gamma-glutamyl-phosphate reductase [Saprospiraceae bacterium]